MLVFDLDGTLLDTAKDLHIALNYALEKHGFEGKTEQETLALLGNGIEALVAGAIENGKENPQFLATFLTFKDYYFAHLNDYTKPYPGIMDLLRELKARHIKMGIVSNKFDEGVKALAERFFKGYIDYAQGVCATVQKKPAPDAVFALIKAQNAENEKNIYIGDSEVDIKTAQNAGLPCISVSWGFRSKKYLQSIGATTIIDSPKELLKYIS
ncbi:MAG: HAD family hydrolase [Alphaproteobacteria bacterium]|nr:HAD family hydrolase [Alphaproteobacteria bacterium]